MSPALPGSRGMFSHLQDALRPPGHRIRLNRHVHNSLADFRALADHLAARPTRFRELIPDTAFAIGACDACQWGMGGVWFANDSAFVWRAEFPSAIQRDMVTSNNRHGSISISDLELAGTIAHKKAVLANRCTLAERTIWLAGDNQASLSWHQRLDHCQHSQGVPTPPQCFTPMPA